MSPRKKIPTKAELTQLQKHYKTDEKIGERLGGVPAYLVAYWRRKKNIPKHSHPKFSEKEIKNLWERLGDDDKCGLELGISKAAFYNWRRRYGFKEKPAFLKLEQLELNFPGLKLHSTSTSLYGKQSIAQKTIARLAQLEKIEAGEAIEIEPDLVISNINTNQVIQEFKKLPTEFVWNPDKLLFSLADCYCNHSDSMPELLKLIRGFVKRQNIKRFFDINVGLAHQITFEKGYIYPGQFILSTDKNSISYGCLSSMAVCIDAKTMASVWATGKLKFQVPKTICININGRRPHGVFSKDVALSVIKQLSSVDVIDKAIEFYGNAITQMSISERFTLSNLSLDMGVRSIICPFDSITRRYLTGRTLKNYTPVIADKNAEYDEIYQINIDNLYPQLGKAGSVNDIKPVSDKEGLPVDLIILGTSSNGRFDD
ncbi:MAG: aconitase family protein, partial [Candidatus Zixiibacteriota bacterium]